MSRRPLLSFFALTFAISWLGAFLMAAPQLARHEPITRITGILMFPAMLLGPIGSGLLMIGVTEGRAGLRKLVVRMLPARFPAFWFAALLLPPCLVLGVLEILRLAISPVFAPNLFPAGVLFGIPAGLFEEIGWTGFAYPHLRAKFGSVRGSILLGLLWSFWHLPVVNWLGTTAPHAQNWLTFFGAFAFAMTAMRVLICRLYDLTANIGMAQLMHISSTGSLVVFSARGVSGPQEVAWYTIYGAALWLVVFLCCRKGASPGFSNNTSGRTGNSVRSISRLRRGNDQPKN